VQALSEEKNIPAMLQHATVRMIYKHHYFYVVFAAYTLPDSY